MERRPPVTAIAYTVVGSFPLYLTAALSVRLQQELSFGTSAFGVVIAAFYLVSAVASQRLGPMLDRRGPTIGFLTSSLVTALAAGWMGLGAHSWVGLAIGTALAGLGNACGQIASNLVIARVVREGRHGLTFAAKQASVPVGAMFAGLAVPWMGGGVDWRIAYLVAAAVAAVMLTGAPRYGFERATSTARPRTMTPSLAVFMVAAALAGGIGNSLASFISDASVTSGLDETTAARVFSIGSAVAIVVRLGGGALADKRQRSGVLELTSLLGVAAVGLALLAVADAPTTFVVGALLAFAGAWGWQGIMFYSVVRVIPLPAATSTGAVAAGVYAGTTVFPPVIGWSVERFGYDAVFTAATVGVLLSAGAIAVSLAMRSTSAGASRV